jgi:hypothetical protein
MKMTLGKSTKPRALDDVDGISYTDIKFKSSIIHQFEADSLDRGLTMFTEHHDQGVEKWNELYSCGG